MSIHEIETAIIQLPMEKFLALSAWFEDYHDRVWDRQIETDVATGRLDELIAEIDAEYEMGLAKPL